MESYNRKGWSEKMFYFLGNTESLKLLDDNDGEVFKKKKRVNLSGGFFFFFIINYLFVRELVADVNGRNYLKLKILTFFFFTALA